MRPLNLVGIINEAVTKKKLLLTLLSNQRKKKSNSLQAANVSL